MYQVIKRDGTVVDFNVQKIRDAILKAFTACNRNEHPSVTDFLALKTTADFESKIKDNKISVEDIQDSVENVLSKAGYSDVAKAYILYRKNHEKMRNIKGTFLDYKDLVNNYLNVNSWRVKENSTVTYSIGGLILSNSGAITANYWLSEIYDQEIADAHRNADMHIHDLSMLTGYCAGWSIKQLIQEGLGGVPGKISSAPASHLSTLCNQMVNFFGILQNEWAGAQAFSSFDTYLAPFVKVDNLTYKQVKQCIQSFIFGVNTPSRWGTQAPFTNITLDWTVPDDLAELNCIVGGKEMDFKYKDCQKEMDMVNKAFIETMLEGDANGRGFQYPIPTYSITKNFDWSETENNKLLFEMTAKYGTPYFSNYINSDMNPGDTRSMCPLYGDEKVLVMNDDNEEYKISTVKNLYNSNKKDKEYYILHNGIRKKAKLHKFDGLTFYRITLSNGHEIVVSHNHENLTLAGVKTTEQLSVTDFLPFNISVTQGTGLDYENGFMVGAFLGDGTVFEKNAVTYSLNNSSKSDALSKIKDIAERKFGAKIREYTFENGCVNVVVSSRMLRRLIDEYVSGKALTKKLDPKCINRSVEFRKGIVDGYMATDGNANSKRLCTSSKDCAETICALYASLGIPTSVNVDDRDETATYSIKPYDTDYIRDDKYMWFNVVSVEKVHDGTSDGYCFEVLGDEEPYFMLPSGLVTHNCRLRLDLRELRKKNGGYFGSGENTGSIGVVTINLPRIAYLAENEEDFYKRLDKLLDLAARSLKIKRETVSKLLEEGLYPYTKHYLGSFKNHFSTIGVVGMNEAGLNAKWLRADMTNPKTQEFAKDVLNHIRERLSDYQELYGDLYNLEATPAESTSYRLAKHDKERYPDIITASDATPYYTNSTHLPVGFTEDVFEALDIQDGLQVLYNSGTVFHAFLGEKLPNWKSAMNLVRKIAENYKLPYYTISPTYSVCKDHGYIKGEVYKCPDCSENTEVYSRITGYYRPVQNWNDGKAQEFKDRKEYNVATSCCSRTEKTDDSCAETQPETTQTKEVLPDGNYLFKTNTCPNCKVAEAKLDQAKIPYEKLLAYESLELADLLDIRQAPTLVVIEQGNVTKHAGVANIMRFIAEYSKSNKGLTC